MRFKRVELSPANKKQYTFSLGRKDIELLREEALLAHKHMPNTAEFKDAKRRLSSMQRAFNDALKIADQDGDDGDRIPLEQRQAYKDEAEANPLLDITRFEIIDYRPCTNCNATGWVVPTTYGEKPKECFICYGLGRKGREVIFWDKSLTIRSSVQDQGRTLKVFLDERK